MITLEVIFFYSLFYVTKKSLLHHLIDFYVRLSLDVDNIF